VTVGGDWRRLIHCRLISLAFDMAMRTQRVSPEEGLPRLQLTRPGGCLGPCWGEGERVVLDRGQAAEAALLASRVACCTSAAVSRAQATPGAR